MATYVHWGSFRMDTLSIRARPLWPFYPLGLVLYGQNAMGTVLYRGSPQGHQNRLTDVEYV